MAVLRARAYQWLKAVIAVLGERIAPLKEHGGIISLALAVILLIPLGINLQTDPNIQGYI